MKPKDPIAVLQRQRTFLDKNLPSYTFFDIVWQDSFIVLN